MAFLTPDKTLTVSVGSETITIKQKITPDGTRAAKNICSYVKKGDYVKPNGKLNNGTGVPKGITVHNTGDIACASGTTPAEQYARATYPNGNMNGVAVHYWVWHNEIWQQLSDNERGWHAADGSSRRSSQRAGETIGGNLDTIAIECIGADASSEATLAKLVAYLLDKHGLSPSTDVYTHNYFYSKKYCPIYILPHWGSFLSTVKANYNAIQSAKAPAVVEPTKPTETSPSETPALLDLKQGNIVTFKGGNHYSSASAAEGSAVRASKAKVTRLYKTGKHPVHLRAVDDSGAYISGVYGWVDLSTIRIEATAAPVETVKPTAPAPTPEPVPVAPVATIEVGSAVRLNSGAKTYTGGRLASFVYKRDHIVKEIKGDRAVITYGGVVVAAVKLSDLTLA